MKNELIICIVERGKSNPVCKAAVQAGAKGATIVYGRGGGELTYSFFHSLNVDASKEVIYILIPENLHRTVFDAVCQAAGISQKGRGIAFAVPVLESSLDAVAQPE
ncbi:MAG: P-II family nitrogen regulator [Kiritimatiellia bacterium]